MKIPRLLTFLTFSAFLSSALSLYGASFKEAKAAEKLFLAKNAAQPHITTLKSGLQYEVIFKGTSDLKPKYRQSITIHYHGTLPSGEVFDSSIEKGEPLTTRLTGLIQGWLQGIKLMSPGDEFRFYIPSKLGYGADQVGPIPPYSVLIFDIELISINSK